VRYLHLQLIFSNKTNYYISVLSQQEICDLEKWKDSINQKASQQILNIFITVNIMFI
jgi:hypothetical protein